MLFFLNAQFTDEENSNLISVALIDEFDREYYAVNKDWGLKKASPWVVENILPHLPAFTSDPLWKEKAQIRIEVLKFIWLNQYLNPEKYSDEDLLNWAQDNTIEHPKVWIGSAINFVVLLDLFNATASFSKGLFWHINIFSQTARELGNPYLPYQIKSNQSALDGARYLQSNYLWLKENFSHPAFND